MALNDHPNKESNPFISATLKSVFGQKNCPHLAARFLKTIFGDGFSSSGFKSLNLSFGKTGTDGESEISDRTLKLNYKGWRLAQISWTWMMWLSPFPWISVFYLSNHYIEMHLWEGPLKDSPVVKESFLLAQLYRRSKESNPGRLCEKCKRSLCAIWSVA